MRQSGHVIELADGSKANVVTGKGAAKVRLYYINGISREVILNNALYVPSYEQDRFSVHAAFEEGGSIKLGNRDKQFRGAEGAVLLCKQVAYYYLIYGMKITDDDVVECHICTQGKMTQNRSRVPDRKATAPLELVHSGLAGTINPVAKDGFKYSLSFVDVYSGVIFVYFLKQKSDTLEATEQFLVDTASIGKVECIRSDNDGELKSLSLGVRKDYLLIMIREVQPI